MSRLHALRTLELPDRPPERFHVLLANGLAPPLRDQSFDTVVTPWFIDLVPPDLRDFLGVIDRLLVPGGRWVDFGPLLYPASRPAACRFSHEEVFELAERAGFAIEKTASDLLRYAVSPLAERGRIEQCLAFSAAKASRRRADAGDPPAWIVLPYRPVPDFDGRLVFYHESVAFRAVIELVDGRRSVNEIAAALAARAGTNPAGMADTVRFCLLETHPACRAAR
jgi:hypothetical protein